MKINTNGNVVREMTPEEIAEMERMNAENPMPESSAEERIAALEAENAQLKKLLTDEELYAVLQKRGIDV